MLPRPKLIITADDYGMSPLFNRGIEELASLRLLTGVSIMIKRPFIDPSHLSFPSLSLGLHLELEEVSSSEAINSQIILFQKKFRKFPTYLDGHQHKHLAPHNLKLIAQIAKDTHLPVRSRFPEDRNFLRGQGVCTPDSFISWHPDRISILRERMRQAELVSVSELVVHPGYFDKNCDYPYNHEREKELAFLKSSHFQNFISAFDLVDYTTLQGAR